MAGAVEGTHTAVVFDPDNHVFQLGVIRCPCLQHLAHVQLEQAGADSLSRGSVTPSPPISLRPGTRLVREWRGVTHIVLIHADGIEWRGQRYRSLSLVARKITGARWSGPRFFGLRRQLDSHSRAGEGDGEG